MSTKILLPVRRLWRDHLATPAQQSLFEPSPKKATQRDLILGLLRSARAQGVPLPLPSIMRAGIAQHGARLRELRLLGYGIRNQMRRMADGTICSSYELLHDPERDAAEVRP